MTSLMPVGNKTLETERVHRYRGKLSNEQYRRIQRTLKRMLEDR